MDIIVENDQNRRIGHDDRLEVGGLRAVNIAGDHVRTVEGNEVVSIHKHLVMHVAGRQVIHIDGAAVDARTSPSVESLDAEVGPTSAGAPEGGANDILAVDRRAEERAAAARLLWLVERLGDEDYRIGLKIRRRVEANRRWLGLVTDDALRARAEPMNKTRRDVTRAQVRALSGQLAELSRDIHTLRGATITRVRAEALHQVAVLDRRTAEVSSLLAAEPRANEPANRGSAEGGGAGGEVEPWRSVGDVSVLRIHGGGNIDSPDGRTILGTAEPFT